MIKLVVFKNNEAYELDIDQKEGIEIVYEVKSLKIDTRSTFFSKSFNLYGTKNNNSFFEHNFTSNNNYENRKYDCRLYINGYDVIEGILTLKDITVDKYTNNIQYNVDIINKLYDFLQEWGDYKLIGNTDKSKDIDFSSIVKFADYSKEQMEASWTATTENFPFVYTITNNGYFWDKTALTNSFNLLTNANALSQDNTGLFPSLYLKTLTELVFNKMGIKPISNFFESNEFNKILVLNSSKASRSFWNINNTDMDYSILYTEQPYPQYTYSGTSNYINFGSNQDPIGSPFMNLSEFTNTTNKKMDLHYDISGYLSNLDASSTSNVSIYSEIYDSGTSTWGNVRNIYNNTITGNEQVPFNINPNNFPTAVRLNSNDKIRFYLTFTYTSLFNNTNNIIVSLGALNFQWDGKRAIKPSTLIPKDLTYADFLKTLFRTFNLVLFYENKELKIEPYKIFYGNSDVLDLTSTNIIDRTSYQLNPLNELLPNQIIATVEKGEDDLSVGFENTYKTNYGNAVTTIGGAGSNIQIDNVNIVSQFDDNHSTFLTPYIYKIENNTRVPIDGGLRFVYWNGLINQNININIDGNIYSKVPTTSLFYDITGTTSSPILKWGLIGSDYSDAISTYNGLTSSNGLLYNYYFDEIKLYNKNDYKLTIKLNLKFDLNFKMNTMVYLSINGIPKYYRIEKLTFSSSDSILSQMELLPISNIDGPINIINAEGQSGSSSIENVGKNTDFYGVGNINNGNFSKINGDNNTIGYSNFIKVSGYYNTINGVSGDSKSVIVEGNYNNVGDNTLNTIVLGDYNEIPSNFNGAMWINNNNVVPYCKTVILTTGETHTLHTNPLKVLDKIDGYYTEVYDAYLSIYYLSGVTPSAYTNRTMGLLYSGDSEANHVALFDNRITTSTVQEKHRGIITTDIPLKSNNIILYTSGSLNNTGNGHFKLEVYYKLHKIIT